MSRGSGVSLHFQRSHTEPRSLARTHIVNVNQSVFNSGNVGHIHVMGRRRDIFQLLLGEDISRDQVDLGVSVLSRLGGRHVNNLAGSASDDDVTALSEGGTLHGVGGGGTSGCAGASASATPTSSCSTTHKHPQRSGVPPPPFRRS